MLQGGFMSVLQAQSRDELRDEVVRFAAELGFDTVAATAVVDRPLSEPEFVSVDNTPDAYRDAFFDMGGGRVDPVMQHNKRQSVPIVWDQ